MRGFIWIITVISFFSATLLNAQPCTQLSSNVVCSQQSPAEGGMVSVPFEYQCFSASMHRCFYVETGGNAGSSVLSVQRTDCDYIYSNPITGNTQIVLDSIFITVVGFPKGGDPCDTSTYFYHSGCFLLTTNVTFLNLPSLPINSSLMVVVGSNHDPAFGDCDIKVQISGTPFELITTVEPVFIFAGQEAFLNTAGASVGANYSWTPLEFVSNPSAPNPAAFPTENTVFYVTSNIGSCSVTDSVSLPVGVPIGYGNAISPNGDYVNDEWIISGIEKFEKAEVTIYDRWGQSVFHSIGYGTPWNGTNRGKYLPTGPYYFVIQLNSPVVFIKPIVGNVAIVR